MIYIEIKDSNIFEHRMPFDEVHGLGKTKEELEQTGILVESLPEAQPQEGQDAVLKYNETDGLYYEYVDRPPTPEDELAAVQETMAAVLMESAMDKNRIAELEAGQSELLMEIASLKMGGI